MGERGSKKYSNSGLRYDQAIFHSESRASRHELKRIHHIKDPEERERETSASREAASGPNREKSLEKRPVRLRAE